MENVQKIANILQFRIAMKNFIADHQNQSIPTSKISKCSIEDMVAALSTVVSKPMSLKQTKEMEIA